jgi:hypothetical protein
MSKLLVVEKINEDDAKELYYDWEKDFDKFLDNFSLLKKVSPIYIKAIDRFKEETYKEIVKGNS